MTDSKPPGEHRTRVRNRNGVYVKRSRKCIEDSEAETENPSGEIWCYDEDGVLEIINQEQEAPKPVSMSSAERALYHPGSKSDAKWKDGVLEMADGFLVCAGTVKPREYPNVKGIDLVRYFTDTYLMNKAMSEEARKKRIQTEQNPLQIPNPQAPISAHVRKSKKRTRRNKRNENSAFLQLPAEVRNLIYAHAMPNGRILIRGNRPNKEFAVLKAFWNPNNEKVLRPRFRLSHLLDNGDIDNGLHISDALLLTCKKIKKETELFMYAQLTFCFDSMDVIHRFLNRASKSGIREIRKLELFSSGYGHTSKFEYVKHKTAHDNRWRETCMRIAEEMPALESLKLDVFVAREAMVLQPGDEWYQTLMTLVTRRPLEHVRVHLSSKFVNKDNVVEVARALEDAMMTKAGREARDQKEIDLAIRRHYEEEAARLERLASQPRELVKRVFSIVVPDVTKDRNATKIGKDEKKYYTSKTLGYARELPLFQHWDQE